MLSSSADTNSTQFMGDIAFNWGCGKNRGRGFGRANDRRYVRGVGRKS